MEEREKKKIWLSVDVRAEFIMIEQIALLVLMKLPRVADKNTILVFIWGGVNIFDKKVTPQMF